MKIYAHIFSFIVSVGIPLAYASAAETELESACSRSNRDGFSCYQLADQYRYGIGVPRDLKTGLEYLTKGCEKGHSESCLHAGYAYNRGEGTEPDIAKGFALHQRACALRNDQACREAGLRLSLGLGVPIDSMEGDVYLFRACRLGNAPACISVDARMGLTNPTLWKDLYGKCR